MKETLNVDWRQSIVL